MIAVSVGRLVWQDAPDGTTITGIKWTKKQRGSYGQCVRAVEVQIPTITSNTAPGAVENANIPSWYAGWVIPNPGGSVSLEDNRQV